MPISRCEGCSANFLSWASLQGSPGQLTFSAPPPPPLVGLPDGSPDAAKEEMGYWGWGGMVGTTGADFKLCPVSLRFAKGLELF